MLNNFWAGPSHLLFQSALGPRRNINEGMTGDFTEPGTTGPSSLCLGSRHLKFYGLMHMKTVLGVQLRLPANKERPSTDALDLTVAIFQLHEDELYLPEIGSVGDEQHRDTRVTVNTGVVANCFRYFWLPRVLNTFSSRPCWIQPKTEYIEIIQPTATH